MAASAEFASCYTWPNPAFPFRLYFDHPRLRIFIIENIFHNFLWMKKHATGIRPTDHFFVILGWQHDDWHALHSKQAIQACDLPLENFTILGNNYEDLIIFRDHGFSCIVVNNNCWLDSEKFAILSERQKLYDAIYVARLTPFKRHYLAQEVPNLALVVGELHGGSTADYTPPHAYKNTQELQDDEVLIKINQSRCGLILSDKEGACYASSEYLLCGLPVVSTHSLGGRSTWYNSYNSIIADATPQSVARAVKTMIDANPCPHKIRRQHIMLSQLFRQAFIDHLQSVFQIHHINEDANQYFRRTYFHKMRNSLEPDFESLFPTP
jgi:glycosyltransferase involved in cell wall biosynthesis